jgi:hypothetical protein
MTHVVISLRGQLDIQRQALRHDKNEWKLAYDREIQNPFGIVGKSEICHFTSGIGNAAENKFEDRERFRKCQQGAFESIVDFKRREKHAYPLDKINLKKAN